MFNEYGPTEAVVGCMIHEAGPDALGDTADVPIGRPAPGVALRIVDRGLNGCRSAYRGSCCISHDGLTSGYLADLAIDEPFVWLDDVRWYRSGDLVRLADAATLVYLGRIDEQIKTGGIRLEPTEVGHALTAHPAIERAVVRLWSPPSVRRSAAFGVGSPRTSRASGSTTRGCAPPATRSSASEQAADLLRHSG